MLTNKKNKIMIDENQNRMGIKPHCLTQLKFIFNQKLIFVFWTTLTQSQSNVLAICYIYIKICDFLFLICDFLLVHLPFGFFDQNSSDLKLYSSF